MPGGGRQSVPRATGLLEQGDGEGFEDMALICVEMKLEKLQNVPLFILRFYLISSVVFLFPGDAP